ncbi:uncharacterized protein A4U43_C10F19360 [Asparagus officinalis]|uniref:Subtilisin-like protease fibronectin type-III domain-containing protein n=1 Tax=Asparagus officinalis TaxID=4686 RepID=A0A5P1E7C0_ASPOF|nr:uncharacterized protein A4U43_C10F19360 [Asparagus officinalis]
MTTAYIRDRDGNPIADEAQPDLGPADLFAIGSGHVNPQAANDPGLIYDIEPNDYARYLCSLYNNYNDTSIVHQMVNCSSVDEIKAEHLNYPSISVKPNPLGNLHATCRSNETVIESECMSGSLAQILPKAVQ